MRHILRYFNWLSTIYLRLKLFVTLPFPFKPNNNNSTFISFHNNNTNKSDLSEPFLAAYMVLFALLLFIYELMWWSPAKKLNKNMRKNFGFMYGLRGKGLYLIFVAFLCFGLGKEAKVKILNYVTAASFLGKFTCACFFRLLSQ